MTYDPFRTGPHRVDDVETELDDPARGRRFPATVWRPRGVDGAALIAFSHHAGGHRRNSTFLCRHLAGHGYVVAALDHSEVAAPELAPRPTETEAERLARVAAIVGSRVPDLRLLLDRVHDGDRPAAAVGHSLGGWTALSAAQSDQRLRSVVALAPGGSARPRPGVLRLPLSFGRAVPTLYLTGDADVPIPVEDVVEVYAQTTGPAVLAVLHDADHQHYVDDVAAQHEALRATSLPGEAAWMSAATRPIAELCPPEQAHRFVRGLTLAHLDATLRGSADAVDWLGGDLASVLAERGIRASVHRGGGVRAGKG